MSRLSGVGSEKGASVGDSVPTRMDTLGGHWPHMNARAQG